MVWGKAGSETLTTAGDACDVTVSDNKFNMILFHRITSGNSRGLLRLNSDTGSNYSYRYNVNGGSEGTGTSVDNWNSQHYNRPNDSFWVAYFMNIATEEKLCIGFLIGRGTAGASNAPNRGETVYKWSNTSDALSSLNFYNNDTGDFDTGTNATVLGDTGQTAATVKILDGLIFEETDTNKHYIYTASTDTWTEI